MLGQGEHFRIGVHTKDAGVGVGLSSAIHALPSANLRTRGDPSSHTDGHIPCPVCEKRMGNAGNQTTAN